MEVAITKISQNGQIVIPSEIRKDAQVRPNTKFIILNSGRNIFLKQIIKEEFLKEMKIINKIGRSERDIKEGRFVEADTRMSEEEIDKLLME